MKNLYRIPVCTIISLALSFNVSAQAPGLGMAARFEIYTTVGAITNTGISQITGEVGSQAGAVTNFGNVNGTMQVPPNGITLQAVTDLNNALAQINSALPVNTIASPLGNGTTLNAGVYHVAGLTSLEGELFLDAQNDPSAVFIFQLDDAFSSLFGAKVRLINGAQACNVFWRANGMISFADETFMKGNVIANNDAFHLGVHDTLEGRIFAINGAITLSNTMAYIPTGCGVPLPTGPAVPVLGSSLKCFAIFTKTGDVTNTGISYVVGDIGSNAGVTGGYQALNTTGNIHPSPDGTTAGAAGDLTTLHNTLNLMDSDIILLYPAQFGNDLVLTPHVYSMGGAASLTGNVYLNAQGLTDAVFVIQIKGALTAASLSKVILVNGTQSKNVFWLVKGAATWGTDAIFNGTVVSTGSISTATGDSINGRIFTTVGAITTMDSKIIGNTTGCLAIVPVNWLYFRGAADKNNVQLQWATTNEINNKFFTLEKSSDGIRFQTLATINATTGSTDQKYSFTDHLPYSIGWYRISQTDMDGRRNYYTTINIKADEIKTTKLTAYTQGNTIFTQASGMSAGAGMLILYNMEGKIISSQNIIIQKDDNIFQTVKPIQKGVYIIKIISAGESTETGRVMVL